jgi:prophage regulatory protein
MQSAGIPETGFVRLPQILSVYPVSRSTWWAGVKSKRYPQPIKLGPNMTAWRAEDIRALIAQQSVDARQAL